MIFRRNGLTPGPKLIIAIGIGKVGNVQMIGVFRSCRGAIPVISRAFLLSTFFQTLTTPLMASSSSNTGDLSSLRLKVVVVGGGIAGDYLYSMGRVIFLYIIIFKGSQLLLRSRKLVIALSFWKNGMTRKWFSVLVNSFALYSLKKLYRVLARRVVLSGELLFHSLFTT